jgi:hypothetical protein
MNIMIEENVQSDLDGNFVHGYRSNRLYRAYGSDWIYW